MLPVVVDLKDAFMHSEPYCHGMGRRHGANGANDQIGGEGSAEAAAESGRQRLERRQSPADGSNLKAR